MDFFLSLASWCKLILINSGVSIVNRNELFFILLSFPLLPLSWTLEKKWLCTWWIEFLPYDFLWVHNVNLNRENENFMGIWFHSYGDKEETTLGGRSKILRWKLNLNNESNSNLDVIIMTIISMRKSEMFTVNRISKSTKRKLNKNHGNFMMMESEWTRF